jgi:hypothetical protein
MPDTKHEVTDEAALGDKLNSVLKGIKIDAGIENHIESAM